MQGEHSIFLFIAFYHYFPDHIPEAHSFFFYYRHLYCTANLCITYCTSVPALKELTIYDLYLTCIHTVHVNPFEGQLREPNKLPACLWDVGGNSCKHSCKHKVNMQTACRNNPGLDLNQEFQCRAEVLTTKPHCLLSSVVFMFYSYILDL